MVSTFTIPEVIGLYIATIASQEIIKIGVRKVWGGRGGSGRRASNGHTHVNKDVCVECKSNLSGRIEVLEVEMRERVDFQVKVCTLLGKVEGKLDVIIKGKG